MTWRHACPKSCWSTSGYHMPNSSPLRTPPWISNGVYQKGFYQTGPVSGYGCCGHPMTEESEFDITKELISEVARRL